MPGPSGFVTVDWDRFKQASNYDQFHDAAPEAGSSNTGASGGYIREKTIGWFAEANGDTDIGDLRLRWNFGARWVHTKQTIGGRVSIADPRNIGADPDGAGPMTGPVCPAPAGARGRVLLSEHRQLRDHRQQLQQCAAVGERGAEHHRPCRVPRLGVATMTRPDPNAQLPGLNFSTPSADVGTVGNSALNPYLSTNIDVGFEYYTGQEGSSASPRSARRSPASLSTAASPCRSRRSPNMA